MLINTPPWYFWSVWPSFSWLERSFLVALGALGVYAIFAVAVTASGVWKMRAMIQAENISGCERNLLALRRRSMRLEKLVGAAFYLFGMVLFLSLQGAYLTMGNSKISGEWNVLWNFAVHFAFAFNVFLGFLILHVLGWFVATRIDRFSWQLKPSRAAMEPERPS